MYRPNPDAFLPDLAMSCGSLGIVLAGAEEHVKAATAFAEGIAAITPRLRAIPQAFAGIAGALRRDYIESIQKAGQTPDMALLQPVVDVFQAIKQDNQDKP